MTKRKPLKLRKDLVHGHAGQDKSRTYNSWGKMIDRCNNVASDNYPKYGGAGVKVCKTWHKFTQFLADMGERPENTSLDRIDPTGNYELGNCRWATRTQQQRNRRSSNNKFGCPGVSIDSKTGAFVAKVMVDKKVIPLYYGYNLDDAIAARKHWEDKHDYRS